MLYQLELDQTDIPTGMSYVFQLDDGRFVIIDGGYFTTGEEDRLYAFLAGRSDGKPVIALWFLTHAHQDHVGAFMLFVEKYSKVVELQRLMYNFHPADLSKAQGDWRVMGNNLATLKELYRRMAAYCTGVETITPKAGDTFCIGELQIEVIFTWEGLYPDKGTINHGATSVANDHSTVVRTSVGGTVILWLADAGTKATAVLLENPDNLACDLVQVAHHGLNNYDGLTRLYDATKARIVLWPACDYGMVGRSKCPVARYILQKMGAAEHHVSGYGTVCLPLPYQPGTATKYPKAQGLKMAVAAGLDGLGTNSPPYRYLTPMGIV